MLARYSEALYAVGTVSTIGANIKRARERAGIKTQGALAKTLGVPQPQMSDWENDRYGAPDLKTLMRIASGIPCSLDVLVHGLDPQYDAAIDLVRHGSGEGSVLPPGGEPDVPASARAIIDRLERELADFKARFSEVQDVASRLVKLAALGSVEERAVARAKRARRGSDRKIS